MLYAIYSYTHSRSWLVCIVSFIYCTNIVQGSVHPNKLMTITENWIIWNTHTRTNTTWIPHPHRTCTDRTVVPRAMNDWPNDRWTKIVRFCKQSTRVISLRGLLNTIHERCDFATLGGLCVMATRKGLQRVHSRIIRHVLSMYIICLCLFGCGETKRSYRFRSRPRHKHMSHVRFTTSFIRSDTF